MYYALPEGSNYAVYSSNGTRVSTTSAAGLSAFGLSSSNLGSKPSTASSTPTTTTTSVQTSNNVNAGRTPITLVNGQTVWYDSAGQAYDASGNTVSNATIASTTSSTPSTNTQTTSIDLTPISGADAGKFDTKAVPASQVQGYNVPNGTYVSINGQPYLKSGDYYLFDSSGKPSFVYQPIDNFKIAATTSTGSNTTNGSSTDTSTTSNTSLSWDAKYGVDQNTWNSLSDVQKAVVLGAYTAKQQAYTNNAQQLTFDQALTQAAQDPNIVAQFADAAKVDKATFQSNLQQLQSATSLTGQQQQQQFENDRKALAEQQGAAGTAYSGFRGQAQQQLGNTESGIVTSSRSQLQQNLDQATRAFEAKYGTSATTPATAQYQNPDLSSNYTLGGLYKPQGTSLNTLSGSTIGGITGSQPIAQQNAVNSKATDIYNLANFTPTVQ